MTIKKIEEQVKENNSVLYEVLSNIIRYTSWNDIFKSQKDTDYLFATITNILSKNDALIKKYQEIINKNKVKDGVYEVTINNPIQLHKINNLKVSVILEISEKKNVVEEFFDSLYVFNYHSRTFEEPVNYLVSIKNNEVAGYLSFVKNINTLDLPCKSKKNVYIPNYFIKEEERGKGIGKELFTTLEKKLLTSKDSLPLYDIYLHCAQPWNKSLTFYKKLGFTIIALEKAINDYYIPYMKKTISQDNKQINQSLSNKLEKEPFILKKKSESNEQKELTQTI